MKTLFYISAFFFATAAEARFLRDTLSFYGVRPMGMGGAFLAMADDSNAIWYNPAGLAQVKGAHINLIDGSLAYDNSDTLNRLAGAATGNFNNFVNLTEPEFFRVGARPTITMPYFGLSIYDTATGFTDLRNLESLDLMADIYYRNDVGAIAAIAIPYGDSLSLGLSLRAFVRSGIDAYVTVKDLLAQVNSLDNIDFSNLAMQYLVSMTGIGWGFGANLGALLRVPSTVKNPKITLAATIDDFGGTAMHKVSAYNQPNGESMKYNFGGLIQYEFGPRKYHQLNLVADYRDAFNLSTPLWQRLYMGAEYRNRVFGIRGGLHHGYWTAGVSIEFPPHTRLHFSSYSMEMNDALWTNARRISLVEIIIGFNPF